MKELRQWFSRTLPSRLPGVARWLYARLGRKLVALFDSRIADPVTDTFLELLLLVMGLAFDLFPDYRENIRGFTGRYVFRTKANSIAATADFRDGRMKVDAEGLADPNVSVVFRDGAAVRNFVRRNEEDVLELLLSNDVAVEGNVNYLFRFGYLVHELRAILPSPTR